MNTKILPLFLVILVGTSVFSACGPSPDDNARILTDVPFGLDQTTTTSTTMPTPTTTNPESELTNQISLYYVSTNRLISNPQNVKQEFTAQDAIDSLLKIRPESEEGSYSRSAIPKNLSLTVEVTRGLAVVDANKSLLEIITTLEQRLAIGQIVLTLTSLPGIGQVLFTVDGVPQSVPRGAGDTAKANQPVAYDDYVSLLLTSTPSSPLFIAPENEELIP
jgi:spore germination protein GerM